ncbi:MAG TPA: AsmA family protein [Nitrospirae bacterium]|nr:putative assembly protein [bacterium BMS3Abin06]HDH13517.1 AsmA family protein [Nitrospirota bacterium]HDZ01043.1 AsmA family protein [Nitrospirota bacterium]
MKKILSITAIVITIIVIALIALIKIYITPERVKAFLVPEVEKALNRKVEIGEINISLLKGIGLKDFAIKEADQENDFVRCKDFVLKFKLLPLLSRKVIIDELKLVSPEIRIKRSKDGKFNFEDIGKKKETGEVKEKKSADEPAGLPVSLLVNKISIQDAKFSFIDMMNDLPDIKSSADIDISIESVDGSEVVSKGSVDLKLDEVVIKKPAEKKIKNIFAGLIYAVRINLESMDVRIDRADLEIQKIPVSITGKIKGIKTRPEINIALSLPKTKTADIQKMIAPFMDLKVPGLSGSVAADVKLKGRLQKPESMKANGDITLEKVGIKYQDMDALLDGNIKFNEKLMDFKLKSTVNKNSAELKGSVSNYFENPEIKLDIYSRKLFLDELIPVGKAGDKPPAGSAGPVVPQKASKEAEPLDLKLTATGKIRVDSAVYKNLTMNDFYMQYKFKDNKLQISKLSARAGKGRLNLSSFIDLSKPGYTYRLSANIDSLHADAIVNSFFPKAKDTVFGIVSLNLKMKGAGTLPESIKKNLAADGDFNIKDGRITGAQITRNLSLFLDVDELKTIKLKQASGRVKIRNSNARLDSVFSSDDISMNPSGNIGLDETLDLAFDLKLSPRLADKAMSSEISKYIKNEEGWGTIPLMVSGTFSNPVYTVDIQKAGKQAVKKEADKFIDKLFDKQDDKIKKQLEPVRELLKGIFR